ncbi:hypothetical protein BH23ACT12_BH23ACT12_00220 [soil metagenome]
MVNRLGYKLWERVVQVVDRLAPWGTTRRRAILLAGYGARVLVEQGPRPMLLKVVKVWEWAPDLLNRQTGRRRG